MKNETNNQTNNKKQKIDFKEYKFFLIMKE
jgi:hypothetical protein